MLWPRTYTEARGPRATGRTNNRFSHMPLRPADPTDQLRRGQARFQRHPNNPSTARLDDVATDDVVRSPVGTLHENVGLKVSNDGVRRVLVEDHDGIDTAQRKDDLRALVLGSHRPGRPLVRTHRTI